MKKSVKSFLSNKQGLAFIEFALFLPLILVLIFGVVEFTRYIIIAQKVERSAYALSNITNQFTPLKNTPVDTEISVANLDTKVFAQFKRAMDAYNSESDRVAIISSITKTDSGGSNDKITINWQRAGGGTLSTPQTVSLLNGENASSINSSDENGEFAGDHPTFPGYSGQLMDGALSDMKEGENMIITEVFYNHTALLNNLTLGLSSVVMPSSGIMKSVTFSRPRNGDLDTLKRPDDDDDDDGGDVTTNSCSSILLVPPYTDSKYRRVVDTDAGTCTLYLDTKTCTHRKVCRECTTPLNAPTTCIDTSAEYKNCSDTSLLIGTYPNTSCTGSSGTVTPPPHPTTLPPS